ncbi:sterile 20-like kinase 3, partial [Ramicandelaber brevisporus]
MASNPSRRYVLDKLLGRGSFGEVHRAIDIQTDQFVAIKIIDLEATDDDMTDIEQEIQLLSQCESPFIAQYYSSCVVDTQLWISMEYVDGGSCYELLRPGPFEEHQIAMILRGLLLGLQYLHSQGKIHRDIKCANVMLSSDGDVKLVDFGVASQLNEQKAKRSTFVGTPHWMAPEVISRKEYDSKADIWSLGITAMEMAHSKTPYSDLHPLKALIKIPQDDPPQLHAVDESTGRYFTNEFCDFVKCCLVKDPNERPSATELLEHPFVGYDNNGDERIFLADLVSRYRDWK